MQETAIRGDEKSGRKYMKRQTSEKITQRVFSMFVDKVTSAGRL